MEGGACLEGAAIGDVTMLPPEVELGPWSDLDRVFGAGFAEWLETAPVGTRAGPFPSSDGLHLVLVWERVGGAMPRLAEVRGTVGREFLAERRRAQRAAMDKRLLSKYKAVLHAPSARAAPAASGPGKGGS